jgi:chaperonin GroEL
MLPVDVIYEKQARDELIKGVNFLGDAVKVTLGPNGRNVIFDFWPQPEVTKDGAKVASRFFLKDRLQHMGARLAQHTAFKMRDNIGDGTTTITVLIQSLLLEGAKMVDEGINPMKMQKGIKAAVQIVVDDLKKHSKVVETEEDMLRVATVSANHDAEIGQMIVDMYNKTGIDGILSLEKGKKTKTTTSYIQGFVVDSGIMVRDFINTENQGECILENPYIFVGNNDYLGTEIIQLILVKIVEKGRISGTVPSLLIFGNSLSGQALSTTILNIKHGKINFCFVPLPYDRYSTQRQDLLNDLAVITKAKVTSTDEGVLHSKKTLSENIFGTAKKVIVTKDKTIILEGVGEQSVIDKHCEVIKEEIKRNEAAAEPNDDAIKYLKKRVANFNNAIASIIVGGQNDLEIKEKFDRIEDSNFATRAAVHEGVLPGGGVALVRASNVLSKMDPNPCPHYQAGFTVVEKAILAPFKQVIINGGIEVDPIYNEVSNNSDYNFGYDAREEKFGNLMDFGILDPTEVIRCALEESSATASLMLTTAAAICAESEKEMDIIPN